jgi:hypothetical protein
MPLQIWQQLQRPTAKCWPNLPPPIENSFN